MNRYVISQILVVISLIVLGITYLLKNKKDIMKLCSIYCVIYATHYLLLNARTGFCMSMISCARNVLFYRNEKNKKDNKLIMLILFIGVAIFFGILTYSDPFSLVSITASIISTYSVWQKKTKVYRILAIPVSLCYIIYGIHIKSAFSVITEIILLVIEIIGVADYFISKNKINKNSLKEELS